MIPELIDNKEQLILPILYKMLIKINTKDNENNKTPLELLAKNFLKNYYDDNSKFRELNKVIKDNNNIENQKKEYLSYTKILYEGIKLKSLPLGSNSNLYRGSFLSNEDIDEINKSFDNKNDDLPKAILFTKTFLTFTKDENIENYFLNLNENKELYKVLFKLEKDYRIDYSLSTHTDFENKVLFFPFSSFEIKNITKIEDKHYEIKLSYLGKYLENFKKDEKIIGNKIPDSKFQDEIIKFGLIDEEYKNINLISNLLVINIYYYNTFSSKFFF